MYQTIGFIGTGNMGSAVARAAARSGLAETILLSNRTPAKAEALAAELPGAVLSTNEEVARTAQLIFLGVKPPDDGAGAGPSGAHPAGAGGPFCAGDHGGQPDL